MITIQLNAVQLLSKFAHKRPVLDWHDYEDAKSYRSESREITKDLHDFDEVLSVCRWYVPDLNSKIESYLRNSSGRLTMKENGELEYITGQYFPTEYRPAATRVLTSILWYYIRDTKNDDGSYKYQTGQDMLKKLRTLLSRRVMKNYFN
jgi:hypothetical protein